MKDNERTRNTIGLVLFGSYNDEWFTRGRPDFVHFLVSKSSQLFSPFASLILASNCGECHSVTPWKASKWMPFSLETPCTSALWNFEAVANGDLRWPFLELNAQQRQNLSSKRLIVTSLDSFFFFFFFQSFYRKAKNIAPYNCITLRIHATWL